MCFINDIYLIFIIDTCVTHLFISHDCVKKLNLKVSLMKYNMVVETPTSGLVVTSVAYFGCLVSIYGKSFAFSFICLPLGQLDDILE